MKKIITALVTATLLAASAISCQEADESRETDISLEVSGDGTIAVSLTATMDELTPADEVKSGIAPVIRLTWASEGDEVFVYDASGCLGTLDVTLKNEDARYAYLNGTIEAPSEGTKVLTCIHAKGLSEAPALEDGKVTVSLAEQNGEDADIPFVVFGTIDYNGQSSIADRFVNFSFATSVVNVNCIDLAMDGQDQKQIDKVYINGLNTACQLSLSSTAAPEVSGSAIGGITRKGVSGGSNKLAFLLSVPVSPVASVRGLTAFQQSELLHSSFTKAAITAGRFINVMYKLEPAIGVESISLDNEYKVISPEDEFTLIATVRPENAAVKDAVWSSSNEAVAAVDENGKVKGIAAGTATITATTVDGGKTATCQVTVVGTRVESVSLDIESNYICAGDEFTLTANVLPEDATVKTVKWTSSDEKVATVDASGHVKGVANGKATITATTVDGAKTASCQVIVGFPIESIRFVPQDSGGKAVWTYFTKANGDIIPDETAVFYYQVQPESLTSVVASALASLKFVSESATSGTKEAPVKSASVVNGLLAVTVESSAVDIDVFGGSDQINFCISVNDGYRVIKSSSVEFVPVRYKYVKFGNNGFKKYCLSNYDLDSDGEISIEEAEAVSSMSASGTTFTSASGIEMFVNLESVDFSRNTKLESLDLSWNLPMTEINLTGCSGLKDLKYDDRACNVTCDFALGRKLTVNGVSSVVCKVYTSGLRKLATAYEMKSSGWDAAKGYYGATSMDDGMANTNKILAATTTCSPVNWARSLGEKWYLPAVNELMELQPNFDAIFSGLPVSWSVYHNTSTEDSNDRDMFYIVIFVSDSYTTLQKNYAFNSIAMKVL